METLKTQVKDNDIKTVKYFRSELLLFLIKDN